MKAFEINEHYVDTVTVVRHLYKDPKNPTAQELVDTLAGTGMSMTSSHDHPEFTKLREMLGHKGYIQIQEGWWNGDTVLKPFSLNGKRFTKGQTFPSAAAMQNVLSIFRSKKK